MPSRISSVADRSITAIPAARSPWASMSSSGAPTANAALFAAMLRATPDQMRGRVNNTVIQAATGLAALAPLTAGLLVEHFSGQWALAAFAAANQG